MDAEPDSTFAKDAWVRALARTASIEREAGVTLPLLIDVLADQFEAGPALLGLESTLTYRELATCCHRTARWGLAQDLEAGDVVSLLMPNCPEYLAIWLGLTRIGVTVALVNTQLTGELLAHSIQIVQPKLLIVAAELTATLSASRPLLVPALPCWVRGSSAEKLRDLEAELQTYSGEPLSAVETPGPSLDGTALYIYTSGTTGMPKAAKVSHFRLLRWSYWFAGLLDTKPNDRMYDCLPLYHSVGGVVATGATLVSGGAVVIRPRFSARDFWRDIREERCTLFQYIGELCRYLVNAPPQPDEAEHCLRLACGNGLRPEVWGDFKTRFKIPRILEYYASTEGNFSLYNCEGEPGAIGRLPAFLAHRLPVALLRVDIETGEPLRNAAGFCEHCQADEIGEAAGMIPERGEARAGRFEGYADPEASQHKVLRNVFKPGDAWYRTGDLMRRDARGFYYFVDRMGDTYRWKGENVSTAEVQAALTASPGVLDGVAYGVAVSGADGRAGMAALVTVENFDLAAFRSDIVRRLPPYARPVFLRLLPAIESTGTLKPKKLELQRAGYDPSKVSDRLYFDDARAAAYLPLTEARYAEIVAGMLRI